MVKTRSKISFQANIQRPLLVQTRELAEIKDFEMGIKTFCQIFGDKMTYCYCLFTSHFPLYKFPPSHSSFIPAPSPTLKKKMLFDHLVK